MKIEPRFTNRVVKALKADGIDLFALGDALAEQETRLKLMIAGCPGADPASVAAAFDDMTPGEATEILTASIIRDLIPQSQREASAKAAAPDKSGEA